MILILLPKLYKDKNYLKLFWFGLGSSFLKTFMWITTVIFACFVNGKVMFGYKRSYTANINNH